jgi:hypothetical protein
MLPIIKTHLLWVSKKGFIIGCLLGGGGALLNHNTRNDALLVMGSSIHYGIMGFIVGITAPVSFPLLCLHWYTSNPTNHLRLYR